MEMLRALTVYIKARTVAAKGFKLSPGANLSHVCLPFSSNPGVGKAYLQCTAAVSQLALQELGRLRETMFQELRVFDKN